jgi:predicted PurR-regulated permease PerM
MSRSGNKNKTRGKEPQTLVQKKERAARVDSDSNASVINSHYVLFAMMLLVFIGCFTLIRPYIHTILLATILAFVVTPIHERIVGFTGGRKNLAAALSCLLLTVVVVLPLFFMIFALIRQSVTSVNALGEFISSGRAEALLSHPMVLKITDMVNHVLPDIERHFPDIANINPGKLIMDGSAAFGRNLLNQSGRIAGNIGSLVASFFLMIFTFFFVVRDEERLIDMILHLLPLTTSQESQIIGKIKDVAKSALLGTFVTALAQGAAGGIAFFICGLPGLFWGMVMAFASLIPMVGTALIWVPACLYLLATAHYFLALFLLVWSLAVVGSIDNFVRPLFMQGGSDMHTLVIFFSILGGINAFGLMGLLYGPLMFGLAVVLLYIYNMEFKEFLEGQD